MSNWRERAEQERSRIAREQEIRRQGIEQAKNDKEALIYERLKLFDQLGIQKLMQEMQRDVWRGQGEIRAEESISQNSGIKTVILSDTTWRVDIRTDIITRRVYGDHYVSTGYDTPGYTSRRVRGLYYEVTDKQKIVAVNIVPLSEESLSSSLRYYVEPDRYELWISGERRVFSASNYDDADLTNFVDQAFLKYATKRVGEIPDFADSRRKAEMEASRYRSKIGKVISIYDSPYD